MLVYFVQSSSEEVKGAVVEAARAGKFFDENQLPPEVLVIKSFPRKPTVLVSVSICRFHNEGVNPFQSSGRESIQSARLEHFFVRVTEAKDNAECWLVGWFLFSILQVQYKTS